MEGSKFLQVVTLLLCLGIGYFVYDTNQDVKALREGIASAVESEDTSAASASARRHRPKSRMKMTVSSSYRIEDRYVSDDVCLPECLGDNEGNVTIDIVVSPMGRVIHARLNANSTISDEDVVEACKKAALKTEFNPNFEPWKNKPGIISYTFAMR